MYDPSFEYDAAEDAAIADELARIDAGLLVEVNPPAVESELFEEIFGG